jgi:hypothetical protein
VRAIRRQRGPRSHVCSVPVKLHGRHYMRRNRIRPGAKLTQLRRIVAKDGAAGALSPHAPSL